MRRCFVQRVSLGLVYLFCSHYYSWAQTPGPDTSFSKKAIENTIQLYHEQMGNQRGLFNGVNYYGYPFQFENGHPYFNTSNPEKGTIVYDNISYSDILLMYDEVAGFVILHRNNRFIQLLPEKISRFGISNHRFIRIAEDSLKGITNQTGFYELLYEGKVSVLKRETKKINDYIRTKGEGILKNVDVETKYYVKKENIIYAIKNKQSILQIYKDKRNEVDQFIDSKELNFRKDKEGMLVEVATYYDKIKN